MARADRLGLHALNIDVTAAQVKDMINVIDANGDGSIDWNEFQMVFGGAPPHLELRRSAQSRKLVWLQVTTW